MYLYMYVCMRYCNSLLDLIDYEIHHLWIFLVLSFVRSYVILFVFSQIITLLIKKITKHICFYKVSYTSK